MVSGGRGLRRVMSWAAVVLGVGALALGSVPPAGAAGVSPTLPVDANWRGIGAQWPDRLRDGLASVYTAEGDATVANVVYATAWDAAELDYDTLFPQQLYPAASGFVEEQDRPGWTRWTASVSLTSAAYVAFWAVSPDGSHSARVLLQLPGWTPSASDPGPRTDLAPVWDVAQPGLYLETPSYNYTVTGLALSVGHDNPVPLGGTGPDVIDSTVSIHPWWWRLELPQVADLPYPVGTPVTITIWEASLDGYHYSSTVINARLLMPSDTAVTLAGPSAPKAGTAPSYTVSARSAGLAVPGAGVTLQTRPVGGTWTTRRTGVVAASGSVALALPALTEGVQVRALLTATGAASATISATHKRVVTVALSRSTATRGTAVTLSGKVTGGKPSAKVLLQRCSTSTSACTTLKSVTTTATARFSTSVLASVTKGKVYWYRVVAPSAGTLTPLVASPRVRLTAT